MDSNRPSATMLDLPQSIREDIYDHVFWDAHIDIKAYAYEAKQDNRKNSDWRRREAYPNRTVPCPTLAIAQTCRLMRPEALVRFHKQATFHFIGFGHVLARLTELSAMASHNDEKTTTEETPKSESKGKQEEEKDLVLKTALETPKQIMKNMRRLFDDFCEMPCVLLDMRLWTWDVRLHDYFPNLKELRLDIQVQCCRCDYKSLAKQYGVIPDDDQQQQQTNRQPELTDGQFLGKLVLSAPKHLRIWFEIYMMDTCTALGSTIIELDPSSEPKVRVKQWFNYYTCSDYLVKLLQDYGLHDEAEEMEKMIDDDDT